MEENATQQQEQVTKTPACEPPAPSSVPKNKDPKKVAAGTALARKKKRQEKPLRS